MTSEWQDLCLGDVARFKAGSVFKIQYQGQRSGELPFIKVSDLNLDGNEHAIRFANNWISRTTAKTTKTAIHPVGATVFAKIGVALTYNRRRLLLRDTAIDNNMMSATPDQSLIRPEYLYLLLKSLNFNEIAHGSALPYLNSSDLKAIQIRLPSLREQDAIAEILVSLEDRIDNLRATNATLEAIAQALFKSWFVDFDPVHAKAEGRAPKGMDAATAALFPGEFEDSELGEVPKGWRSLAFGEIAQLRKGTVNPGAEPTQIFHHYSLPAFDAGQLPLAEQGSSIKSNKTPVPSGAVLVSKLNPHIPRIWFVGDVSANAVCSTEFLVWTPRDGIPEAMVYCAAASKPFNASMRQLVTGTSNSHQRVRPAALASVHAAIADPKAIAAFGETATPLLARVERNRHLAGTLAHIRDTLLPRLISGKLSLPKATDTEWPFA